MPADPSTLTTSDRARPWIVRLLWLLLPVTLGLAGQQAVADASAAVRLTCLGVGALVWGVGLLALLVPHPLGLTALRLVAPGVLLAAGAVMFAGEVALWMRGLAVVGVVFALLGVLSAEIATWCVDGSSYPNESRYALSTPPRYLVVAIVMCVLTGCSIVAAPVVLASQRWVLGAVLLVAAPVFTWAGVKSIHQLSRRFVVFVPAGFVVHDPLALLDPVLFRKALVERIGPADADTDSLDLTLGAAGIPIEVLLEEKVELARLSDDRKTGEVGRTGRFMVSPMRPGAVLKEAAARRYPVG